MDYEISEQLWGDYASHEVENLEPKDYQKVHSTHSRSWLLRQSEVIVARSQDKQLSEATLVFSFFSSRKLEKAHILADQQLLSKKDAKYRTWWNTLRSNSKDSLTEHSNLQEVA